MNFVIFEYFSFFEKKRVMKFNFNYTSKIVAAFYTVLLIAVSNNLFAPPPPPPPGATPIDGGAGLLALMGIGYGARKLYKRNKEENI
jgi:hypothetical protein